MIPTPHTRSRTAASLLLGLLLVVQGMMPAGYMPASAESGWLVMLCPEGLPEGFLGASSHHHHALHGAAARHADGGPAQHGEGSHDSYCPLGHAVGTPAIAELALAAPAVPVLAGFHVAPERDLVLPAARPTTQPRAPPRS